MWESYDLHQFQYSIKRTAVTKGLKIEEFYYSGWLRTVVNCLPYVNLIDIWIFMEINNNNQLIMKTNIITKTKPRKHTLTQPQ